MHYPTLRLVRIPGESGPILRCSGELSVATSEALRRELALLIELGHPALILNLSGCSEVDLYGVATVVEACEQLQRTGRRAALVAGAGSTARLLRELGIPAVLPVYVSEDQAATALRGSAQPPLGPRSWAEARQHTLARWRAIQAALEQGQPQPQYVLRMATSMFGLCARAEELFQEGGSPTSVRCYCCPVFFELGSRRADVGCRSVIDPILQAVRRQDLETARAQVAEMIWSIKRMPLPPDAPSTGFANVFLDEAQPQCPTPGARFRRQRSPASPLPMASER
jgi:anti-anti-sigma factor